jgi:hypothetical protein
MALAAIFALLLPTAASAEDPPALASIFPEKVGTFQRVSASKNDSAIHGDIVDAATSKYVSGASEIGWQGTRFATSDQAFEALEKMRSSFEQAGAGISSVKNVEGKVRYAVIETADGVVCCWVNKQYKNLFFVVTGKLPEIEGFMRAQTTW